MGDIIGTGFHTLALARPQPRQALVVMGLGTYRHSECKGSRSRALSARKVDARVKETGKFVLAVIGIERRVCCKREVAEGIFWSGAVVSARQFGPLQLTERDMVMELGMDRTVDDPDLQAGVSVTKGYRGFHHIRAVLRPSIDNRLSVLMSFVNIQP